jgi:iron complex transport system substrate-binding protein
MSLLSRPIILLLALLALSSCQVSRKNDSNRFVVLSPELAELIVALGAEDMIVGVTSECDYPASLRKLTQVGSFGSVDLEKVISLKPSIGFTSALEQESIALNLKKLGLRVESSYPGSLDDMLAEILKIGTILGRVKEAQALYVSLREDIRMIREEAMNKPQPKVYLEIYKDPLMSVADKSFVGELLETAGADNIFNKLERDYSRVKAEDVIHFQPDIMICYSQDTLAGIQARKGWQVVPAIKNGMVFFEDDIHPDLIQRAGPRSIQGMQKLAELYNRWRQSQYATSLQ